MKSIFRYSFIILILTICVKIIGFLKEMLIAKSFGTGSDFESFTYALLLATFLTNVISYSIVPAYMPVYIQYSEINSDKSKIILNNIFGKLILSNLIITLSLYLFAPFLFKFFGFNRSAEVQTLCLKLLFILIPVSFFDGITYFLGSVYESRQQFYLSNLVPISKQILVIVYLVLFSTQANIVDFSLLWVLGSIISFAYIFYCLKRDNLIGIPSISNKLNEVSEIYRSYYPLAFGALIYSGVPIIDQTMALFLKEGSLGILSYADKLSLIIVSVVSPAIVNVLLPYFSKSILTNEILKIKKAILNYLGLIFIGSTLAILLIYFYNQQITALLFERGEFNRDDTVNVGKAFMFYSFQIPFYLGTVLFMRCLSALKKNSYIVYGTLLSLFSNLILNLIFIRYFDVFGIALSTSVTFVISFLYYFYFTHLELNLALKNKL